jgi:C4-dicarboxylate-specific signal transduction histidine kinase
LLFLDPTKRQRAEGEARASELGGAEARAELAHANRVATMGYLAASIVHEVKQPIAAMVANAQAALHWLDDPVPDVDEARQALSCIVEVGARADALVDRTRVEINAAIREAIELVGTEAAKNGVSVTAVFVETLPPISGDRVELQQVALNLIINAIEAMTGTS